MFIPYIIFFIKATKLRPTEAIGKILTYTPTMSLDIIFAYEMFRLICEALCDWCKYWAWANHAKKQKKNGMFDNKVTVSLFSIWMYFISSQMQIFRKGKTAIMKVICCHLERAYSNTLDTSVPLPALNKSPATHNTICSDRWQDLKILLFKFTFKINLHKFNVLISFTSFNSL